jgi:upstream activation factor subunit UAF30
MAKASKKKPAAKAAKKAAKKVAKKAVKKATVKKVAKKAVKKAKTKRKANPALLKPMTPSSVLAEIVGAKPASRGQIIKNLWAYIKKNGLQDKVNKRLINADEKLKKVFGGKSVVNMFEMTKHVSKHIQ